MVNQAPAISNVVPPAVLFAKEIHNHRKQTAGKMVRVVFLHPDLGIGGAERAVIDAALALKSSGNSVHFVTAHHDPNHCFPETRDGTLTVTAVGDWLPRHIFNRFSAVCAYARMIYAAVYLVFFSRIKYDVVFCDQISACIPVLRAGRTKVLFYCHFPDMLLTQRRSFLKRLYRRPIDWLEEVTTGMAHVVLVNSKFTGSDELLATCNLYGPTLSCGCVCMCVNSLHAGSL